MLARWLPLLLPALVLLTPHAIGFCPEYTAPEACVRIAKSVSDSTSVFYPNSATYKKDISHWSKLNTKEAKCTVEPGTAADVGIILDILGSTRTPFSIKGGGHSPSSGFSSSSGVQIAMYRFTEIKYIAASQSVVVGAGLIWDDVYAALTPYNVTVVGARMSTIGVGGLTLGGGYSWKTNQHGLIADTILAYELVKPDGHIVTVTEKSDPELFFALRGGLGKFGVVTHFTFRTFPQGQVWGGLIAINGSEAAAVNAATAKFSSSVTDPKASMVTAYGFALGQLQLALFMFNDGPTPPPGIFDDVLAIPSLFDDTKTRDYLSLIRFPFAINLMGQRIISNTVPLLEHTPKLLDTIVNETLFWGTHFANGTSPFIAYAVEPFLETILTHSTSASAYPPTRSVRYYPTNILFTWDHESSDLEGYEASRQAAKRIYDVAIEEGQDIADAPLYPNYAMFDTPLVKMYGARNVERMKKVKEAVDPYGVMDLTGGFKF